MNNIKLISLIAISVLLNHTSLAQKGETLYSTEDKTRHIDHSEYKDIKGSPYLFEEWYTAKVIGMDGTYTEYLKMNFNGLTHQLEILEDGKTQVLIENTYLKAIFNDGTNEYTFMAGIHPDLGRDKICIPFDGQEIKFIKDFKVRIEESVMQTPGAATVFEKFARSTDYYIMKRGNLIKINLRKKSILKALDNKEVDLYVKNENLKMNSENDLIKVLQYYETAIAN
jgi:hypothetical protein